MAPIGLAHRPITHAFVAEWTDLEPEPVEEDDLRGIVERRRRDATEPPATSGSSEPDPPRDSPSAEGWLAGEPMS